MARIIVEQDRSNLTKYAIVGIIVITLLIGGWFGYNWIARKPPVVEAEIYSWQLYDTRIVPQNIIAFQPLGEGYIATTQHGIYVLKNNLSVTTSLSLENVTKSVIAGDKVYIIFKNDLGYNVDIYQVSESKITKLYTYNLGHYEGEVYLSATASAGVAVLNPVIVFFKLTIDDTGRTIAETEKEYYLTNTVKSIVTGLYNDTPAVYVVLLDDAKKERSNAVSFLYTADNVTKLATGKDIVPADKLYNVWEYDGVWLTKYDIKGNKYTITKITLPSNSEVIAVGGNRYQGYIAYKKRTIDGVFYKMYIYNAKTKKLYHLDLQAEFVRQLVSPYDPSDRLYFLTKSGVYYFSEGVLYAVSPNINAKAIDIVDNAFVIAPYITPPGKFYDFHNIEAAKIVNNKIYDIYSAFEGFQKYYIGTYDLQTGSRTAVYFAGSGIQAKYISDIVPLRSGYLVVHVYAPDYNNINMGKYTNKAFLVSLKEQSLQLMYLPPGTLYDTTDKYLLFYLPSSGEAYIYQKADKGLPSLLYSHTFLQKATNVALVEKNGFILVAVSYGVQATDIVIFDRVGNVVHEKRYSNIVIADPATQQDDNRYLVSLGSGKVYKMDIDTKEQKLKVVVLASGLKIKAYSKHFYVSQSAVYTDISVYPFIYGRLSDKVKKAHQIPPGIVFGRVDNEGNLMSYLKAILPDGAIVQYNDNKNNKYYLLLISSYKFQHSTTDMLQIPSPDSVLFVNQYGAVVSTNNGDVIAMYRITSKKARIKIG